MINKIKSINLKKMVDVALKKEDSSIISVNENEFISEAVVKISNVYFLFRSTENEVSVIDTTNNRTAYLYNDSFKGCVTY